jgi:hypothetical protein
MLKRLRIGGGGGRWCQVLDAVFEASGDVWINKNPCDGRGFGCDWIRCWGGAYLSTRPSCGG